MIINKNILVEITSYVIPIILISIPIFLNLDVIPIHLWDESRLAINSYEMSKNGNFLVPTFEGVPDLWNTKPPLMIWLQVVCIKIIGNGELAVRLPSAIAAFLTSMSLILFSKYYFKNKLPGVIASLILVTSVGYIQIHGTRTGDYDALLTLFTTCFILLFFLFIETGNIKFYTGFIIAVVLCVYTKSVQGLIFLPALAIYFIAVRKWNLLLDKRIYIYGFLGILSITIYYVTREYITPGYLKLVWENELGGRYINSLENHKEEFMYYFNMLQKHHFPGWMLFLPFGMLAGFFFKDNEIKKFTFFSALNIIFYWLVISFAETKLEWYEMPLFPFLSILVAMGIFRLFYLIQNSTEVLLIFNKNILAYIVLLLLFYFPYLDAFNRISNFSENSWEKESYELSYYLKDAEKNQKDIKAHFICYNGYHPQLSYYVNLYNDKNWQMDFKNFQDLKSGDLVIATQQEVKYEIEKRYAYEELESYYSIKRYKIR